MQKYEDADYQPLYFVADSILEAMIKLRRYAHSIKRPFSVAYDPFTRSVELIKKPQDMVGTIERFKADLSAIADAIEAMCLNRNPNLYCYTQHFHLIPTGEPIVDPGIAYHPYQSIVSLFFYEVLSLVEPRFCCIHYLQLLVCNTPSIEGVQEDGRMVLILTNMPGMFPSTE
ncbi:unnamed protein product [Toxocara canis]|uniref:Biopterin-dependent aromatic amino acid hydroxylase family profile domain-containing protein n=1 Tax=Toxocara canis TaxID=6265 RepID=A0A3P7FIA0_TOXCA|nr:unnamed protein product [Toxocara canis]